MSLVSDREDDLRTLPCLSGLTEKELALIAGQSQIRTIRKN